MKDTLEYDDPVSIAGGKLLTRSIALPVQECLSHSKQDYGKILHNAWRQSTDLANWASHTLVRNDIVRLPSMTELPPWQAIDLYALAFGRAQEKSGREYWQCSQCKRKWSPSQLDNGRAPEHKKGKEVCSGTGLHPIPLPRPVLPAVKAQFGSDNWKGAMLCAASVLREVQRKYLNERGKILWRRERRSPEFLYPFPFPVHKDAWVAMMNEENQPLVNLKLPGGTLALRLRTGKEMAHGMKIFKKLAASELDQQALKVCRELTHSHNGRKGQVEARAAGGAGKQFYRVMLRIAFRMEAMKVAGDNLATLTTGVDPLLTLQIGGVERAHYWHCTWVKQWILEHRQFLDAFSDDLKYEKRWPKHKRQSLNRYRERRVAKQHDRMKSFQQETAHQVCAMLVRKGVAELIYDDSNREFVDEFPWFTFATCLENKCAEHGIKLRSAATSGSSEGADEAV